MYNRKIITLLKTSNSSFLDCLYFPSFKFFDAVFSVLKTSNFTVLKKSINDMYVVSKQARNCDLK